MAAVNMAMSVFDAVGFRVNYGDPVVITTGANRGKVGTYVEVLPCQYSSHAVTVIRLFDNEEIRIISKLIRKIKGTTYVSKW